MAAANKLQELRMWTRAGLEYAITHHEVRHEIENNNLAACLEYRNDQLIIISMVNIVMQSNEVL